MQYENDFLESVDEYTISTWVKFDALPWETESDMVLFDFQPGFNCKLTMTRALSCQTQNKQGKALSVTFDPLIDHWYILIL